MHQIDLNNILYPMTESEFLSEHVGKTFLHIPGECTRFAELFSWPDLNEILMYNQINPGQIRVFRDGVQMPPESFMLREERHLGRSSIPAVNARALVGHLRNGSTLVVDGVDKLSRPVRLFCERLERSFAIAVGTNLYAAWGTNRGFNLHADVGLGNHGAGGGRDKARGIAGLQTSRNSAQ